MKCARRSNSPWPLENPHDRKEGDLVEKIDLPTPLPGNCELPRIGAGCLAACKERGEVSSLIRERVERVTQRRFGDEVRAAPPGLCPLRP